MLTPLKKWSATQAELGKNCTSPYSNRYRTKLSHFRENYQRHDNTVRQNEIMSALRQSLEKENILLASVRAVCLSLQASYAEISKSMSSMFGKRLDLVDQRLAHLQEKIESLGKENNKAQQTMETSILAILEPLRQ